MVVKIFIEVGTITSMDLDVKNASFGWVMKHFFSCTRLNLRRPVNKLMEHASVTKRGENSVI